MAKKERLVKPAEMCVECGIKPQQEDSLFCEICSNHRCSSCKNIIAPNYARNGGGTIFRESSLIKGLCWQCTSMPADEVSEATAPSTLNDNHTFYLRRNERAKRRAGQK